MVEAWLEGKLVEPGVKMNSEVEAATTAGTSVRSIAARARMGRGRCTDAPPRKRFKPDSPFTMTDAGGDGADGEEPVRCKVWSFIGFVKEILYRECDGFMCGFPMRR
jgi:hypothetical protein